MTFKNNAILHKHQGVFHPKEYVAHNILYHCPIDNCKGVYLKKNDLKIHFKQKHRNYTPKENDFEQVVGS